MRLLVLIRDMLLLWMPRPRVVVVHSWTGQLAFHSLALNTLRIPPVLNQHVPNHPYSNQYHQSDKLIHTDLQYSYLEDERFTIYDDKREKIVTSVSAYGLQRQSNEDTRSNEALRS